MVAAWAHHSDTRRSRQRRPALPALAVAAMLAAALTGCTLGQEPQAARPRPGARPERAGRHRQHPRGRPEGRAVRGHRRPRPGDRQRGDPGPWTAWSPTTTWSGPRTRSWSASRSPSSTAAASPASGPPTQHRPRRCPGRPQGPQTGHLSAGAAASRRAGGGGRQPSASRTRSPPASSPACTARSPARPSRASGRWST